MSENFFLDRELDCRNTVDRILEELPHYAVDFFIGIENTTSPLTRKNYAYDLRIFYQFLSEKVFRNKKAEEITLSDLENLSPANLERFLSYLSLYQIGDKVVQCKEEAKSRKLATVRSFYKYFFNRDRISINVAAKISMPKLHEKEIIRLEHEEMTGLLDVVSSGTGLSSRQLKHHKNSCLRDIAIITLFLGTGIRISELVSLNVDDIDFSINGFRVTRKGGNRVILYFSDEVAEALGAWMDVRRVNEKLSKDEQALFISGQNRRITTRAVQNIVKKYSQINTPLKNITPHKLRSTFGTNLYHDTGDIYVVADVLGHSDVNTTKRHYAAITDEIRRNAVKNVKLKQDED